ncbi:flavin reductase family protein [Mesorhizobium xinjiangense]|uniref:flavin reductase family protein n=1 Tax=Mesorhizobium xinjiangense TaxID=2678685 RepID=UPI0012EE8878|nr:flavin reductase family protein [Mesorhizobium xinjiangense]
MDIDIASYKPADQYKLLSSTVVPRPIALISSRSAAGIDNAAPFSFFNILGEAPPVVAVGIKNNPDGTMKDTAANIVETREFVVNMVDEATAEAMNQCSIDCPPEVSEVDLAGLTLTASNVINPPRITESPVSFECRLLECLGTVPDRCIIIGEIVSMHIRDGLLDPETLRVDIEAYRPVGRIFASLYLRASDTFEMKRPFMAPAGAG